VLAEQAHGSAVLACVSGGLYIRRYFSASVAPLTRIQARAVWELLVFVLNGVIFILIGLQLGSLRDALPSGELGVLTLHGTLVCAVAIIVRLIWVPVAAWVPRALSRALRERDPMPSWSELIVLGWTGMRGIVSLAAAMALPLTTAQGTAFPLRAEIIMITFMVILATLLLQGISLPFLIRALHLPEDRGIEHEERGAREQAAAAALAHLDKIAGEDWAIPTHIEQLRVHYAGRRQRYAQVESWETECTKAGADAFRRLRHETLTAERLRVIDLRNDGVISDEILHRLEHELDVEALRFGVGERRIDPWQHSNAP
jgi:CPA1 family monovalent cation:H+ antiporter